MVFSVVVPIYNVEAYLHQCIDSVLSQSYNNFELILVDDGSPDNSSAICEEYGIKDSRVKVIHKTNGGLVSARKAGVKIASGDYIIALDGDDWLADNCLEELSKIIESNHPDVIRFGFVIAEGPGIYINKPIKNFSFKLYNRDEIEKEIIPYLFYGSNGIRFPHSICGACVRSALYLEEQLAVEDRIKIGEDGAVMRPVIYKAQSVYVMKDCLYFYRRNLSSMTKDRKPFSMENFIWIAEHYSRRMDLTEYDLQEQFYRSMVQNAFTASATQFWQKVPYSDTRKRILNFIAHGIVNQAINSAEFRFSFSRYLMLFTLKSRAIPLLWLYSKIKKF